MQIHEIFRQRTDEGILKGVANKVGQGVGAAAKGVATAGLNTAEYLAKSILDKAGVPADQQGQYSKYGAIAAGQRQGIDAIAQQEHAIANQLAREWSYTGTLNGAKAIDLQPQQIKQAADALNQAGQRLDLNLDKIAQVVQAQAPEYYKERQQQKQAKTDEVKDLMAQLEQNYELSRDPQKSAAERQQAVDQKNKVIGQLKQLGQPVDKKYVDDVSAAAKSAVIQGAGKPMMTAPAAAASPARFDYDYVMKQPSMQKFIKKPTTTPVTKPVPAVAESLAWSKDFDPSERLYRRITQGQTQ